jgi:hypothetical protein
VREAGKMLSPDDKKTAIALLIAAPIILLPLLIVSLILYYRRTRIGFFEWHSGAVFLRIMAWANLIACIDALLQVGEAFIQADV